MSDNIILVDIFDNQTGVCSKEKAHAQGALHRAFSVFLYGEQGLLIQRRALNKYHSGGLWANTCCSHPREGENTESAVKRRLFEETGITCETEEYFSFVYHHSFANNLYEYEYDHVFLGLYNGNIKFNPNEICEMRWVEPAVIHNELLSSPTKFAPWFLISAPRVLRELMDMGVL